MKTFTFKPKGEKKKIPYENEKRCHITLAKTQKLHNETIKNNQAYVELSKNSQSLQRLYYCQGSVYLPSLHYSHYLRGWDVAGSDGACGEM